MRFVGSSNTRVKEIADVHIEVLRQRLSIVNRVIIVQISRPWGSISIVIIVSLGVVERISVVLVCRIVLIVSIMVIRIIVIVLVIRVRIYKLKKAIS